MAKVSRPIIYLLVAGAVGYAVVLLTEPEAPKKKPTTATARTGQTAPPGFTEADMTARFDRYNGTFKDAFQPKIVTKKPEAVPTPPPMVSPVATGVWTLTGVTVTDGVRSALLESSTGDTVFLKAGDQWNGLKVVRVEPTEIIFVNAEGRETRLAFAVTMEETPPTANPVAPVVVPSPPAGTAPGSGAVPPAQPGTPPTVAPRS